MKMIDMTCPKCSAVLKVDDKKEKAVCEYCGYQVLIEREDTPEELRAKARKIKGKLVVAAVILFFIVLSLVQT